MVLQKKIIGFFTIFFSDELVELLPALLSMDLVEKGRRLQKEMLDFLFFAAQNYQKIWPAYLEVQNLPGPLHEIVWFSYLYIHFMSK